MSLTIFDKVRLANSAVQRAELHCLDHDRFRGEYDTVRCWHQHRVTFGTSPRGAYSYVQQ
jgi:hypothetical protein